MSCGVVGIDCGSTTCKGVLRQAGETIAMQIAPTGWNPRESAALIVERLLDGSGLSQGELTIVSTGYGRVGIDFATKSVTEITCHAIGGAELRPGVGTIIDIGGQDCKAIRVENGKVLGFQMNDKCAAGTGRFLEMTALRLGVDPGSFQDLLASGKSCTIGSMCAVFADSEIVSLLAAGESREAIAGGVVAAIASRAVALAARLDVVEPVLLTGGLSRVTGLCRALANKLGCDVETSPLSQYAGAIGAAILGERMA